ncbi:MAG: M55 family metallopeptidase, partial [Proteobacteria bacterium]|nr:M55 family metallopeptidase [Pseudomonadota bacterium]
MSMSGPLRVVVLSVALGGLCESALSAHTPLADQPLIVSDVPPNVMLALSVEFPTAITRAHQGNTFDTSGRTEYLGYFDPRKCYVYEDPVFVPSGALTSADKGFACSGTWSGNFMNWATMQGVDTFRWVLTGGNRVVDEPQVFGGASGFPLGRTVLQRAYASPQGSYLSSNFPDRILDAQNLSSYTGLGSAYTGRTVTIRNGGMGIGVRFCTPEDICSVMTVNVEVCRDDSRGRPLEAFCQAYQDPTGTLTVYKPVGLIQRYKDKMYFGAFGYLQMGEANSLDAPGGTSNAYKDGGVLRSPVQSVANEISETGAFRLDPYGLKDASKAIGDSGTINYLNKFGSRSQAYKYYDPVSELYAEVIKYLRHKSPTASYLPPANADPLVYDGFPIFTRWDDPAKDAKYPDKGPLSCKRNYVIGIGDTNSNFDFELSGMGAGVGGMMCGIDSSFDACFLVGYHAMAGTAGGIMEHTITGIMHGYWINGMPAGEIAMSAATAGVLGVPLVMVSSDAAGCKEAGELIPGLATAVTKTGIGRYMGRLKHPSVTEKLITEAAQDGLQAVRDGKIKPWVPSEPVVAKLEFNRTEEADHVAMLPNARRVDDYTIEFSSPTWDEVHAWSRRAMSIGLTARSA